MQDIYDFLEHEETIWESIKYFPIRKWHSMKNVYYEIKYFFQRVFRGHSDMQVIEMYSELAHHILPIIKDYKESNQGYPGDFCEYVEHEWKSREDYDKALEEGKILGGGAEAWDEIVDKIIFAFTFIISEDSRPRNKKEREWVKEFKDRYGDIWEEKEENSHRSEYHLYSHKDGRIMHCPPHNYTQERHDEMLQEGWEYGGYKIRKPFYHDDQLSKELNDKCNEGLELFGRWFRSFWT